MIRKLPLCVGAPPDALETAVSHTGEAPALLELTLCVRHTVSRCTADTRDRLQLPEGENKRLAKLLVSRIIRDDLTEDVILVG